MTAAVPGTHPDAVARELFGAGLPVAERFVGLLADTGVTRGLLGPREVPRLWERHLVNSVLMAELLPDGATVVDIGSGAGLPGIPLAIARPDLRLVLVEPMLRRTTFLTDAVSQLGLADRVGVVRGRADDPQVVETVAPVDWVVARAVAPLDRLVRWTVPLLRTGGSLLALKGESAAAELASAHGVRGVVHEVSRDGAKTWVVQVRKGRR